MIFIDGTNLLIRLREILGINFRPEKVPKIAVTYFINTFFR